LNWGLILFFFIGLFSDTFKSLPMT
jgi:hypothetical protein